MAKLIYSMITSLDGYVVDQDGDFGWAAPDEELHRFVNELNKAVGTYLYGRRVYEEMLFWETADRNDPDLPAAEREFVDLWHGVDKIVYSTAMDSVSSARTRLERHFDADVVRELKESADADIAVAGPTLASHAIKAGLVDEYHLFIVPVVVGGGIRFLPHGARLNLELLDSRHFGNGVVHLRYQ